MAKRDMERTAQMSSSSKESEAVSLGGAWADSTSTLPMSDAASQMSKDTASDRKRKGWTNTLKKATSSIIYMAMPPTSADNVPMVVAQTPMSPDRLIPSVHSPLLQAVAPLTTPHPIISLDAAASSSSLVSTSPTSPTRNSSTHSFASSSAASSSTKPRGAMESKNESNGSNATRSKQRSPSSASSTTSSSTVKRSAKGKEKAAEPDLPAGEDVEVEETYTEEVTSRFISFTSPSTQLAIGQVDVTTTMAALSVSVDGKGSYNKRSETAPSPPSSPVHRRPSKGNASSDRGKQQALAITEGSELKSKASPTMDRSRVNIALEASGSGKTGTSKKPTAPTREDIVLGVFDGFDDDAELRESEEESAVSPKSPTTDKALVAKQGSASQPLPTLDSTTPASNIKPIVVTAPMDQVVKPTIDTGLRTTVASKHGPDSRGAAGKDGFGFLASPPRPAPMPRKLSKSSNSVQLVKNAPWVWHQDGFHHQRLESHQILTKEQVFEQFHLDLEQEGPNGFFLFKLVKKFKKQDPSMAMTTRLLDAELTASPTSTSPCTPTPSAETSLEAITVSQKIKRQLLLQKRKKQRKSSSDSEEEEGLDALLTMTQQNSSLQNLNSTLSEVMDAVENLKGAEDWSTILNRPRPLSTPVPSLPLPRKPLYPDSDGEYTSRDKEAMDVETLEKRRGVYATGRHDGMNLLSKKKYKANQRRSSVSTASRKTSSASTAGPGGNGADLGGNYNNDRRGSDAVDGSTPQPFKKQAVSQLHIYSRNGLKFKFDVMEDNELHFVEASKKYTFMDPLAANRQPELELNGNDTIAPLRSPGLLPPSSNRRPSAASTASNDTNRALVRSSSSRSKSTISSASGSSRRVFVTRLGRHTLLTYGEYKVLAKSASSMTLGAKLLFQRSIPSFYSSGSGGAGHNRDSSQASTYEAASSTSPTRATFASSTSPSATPSNNAENSDYFSTKKKSRSIPGFSKAVAAIKSPSSSGSNQANNKPRPIVTPYNPNNYLNKSLTVSAGTPTTNGPSEDVPSPALSTPLQTPASERSGSSSAFDLSHSDSPSTSPLPPPSPATPMSSTSSSANPYASIKRQGNQAGIKFQHLFVTVHQRLQKLELETGASFYGSGLVQWTVVEDPAELRWWRDKIGVQMIGRLEGDDVPSSSGAKATAGTPRPLHALNQSAFSSTISLRSSYVSAESSFSEVLTPSTSSSTLSSRGSGTPFKSQVSVERLGYRFLRVSGHMGTLKVTVSEQVEARAVALAVRAEMLRQKRIAQQQQGQTSQVEEDPFEQPWVETVEDGEEEEALSDDDSDVEDGQVNGHEDYYDGYEYDAVTGQTRLRKKPSVDRFSRRKRHDRKAKKTPLIERMTMIVGQSRVFKGEWYMKNVYKYYT